MFGWFTGEESKGSYGSSSTAEQVTTGIDLTGKVVILTGGASGIGVETARVLALRRAHVILPVRKVAAGEEVKKKIVAEDPDAHLTVMDMDLASLASVRSFAAAFLELNIPLHILINNAGIMGTPFSLSADGHELQFATNHLGHFLLTKLLLGKLKATANETGQEGRIVALSSMAHKMTYKEGIRFGHLDDKEGYSPFRSYGQSKLANVLFANELARRLKEEDAKVTANSVHPGVIMTNLAKGFLSDSMYRITNVMHHAVLRFLLKTVPQGAATTCFVATHPSNAGVSGKYFADCKEKQTTALGQNSELAKMLWEVSEEMIK